MSNKYTAPSIQNECLGIMALEIVRQKSQSIGNSRCYSIMVDECTDVANKEQFAICTRWVDGDLQDHKDFIEVNGIAADVLVHIRMNVNISKCHGHCNDGASNMRGSRNGVATQISSEEKCALFGLAIIGEKQCTYMIE